MAVATKKRRPAGPTSEQTHLHLKGLAKTAQKCLYDMLRDVDLLLSDHDYVDKHGGEGAFLEALEADEFSHWGGKPSLEAMLRAFRYSPDRETWREYRFNVQAMIDIATPAKGEKETQYTNWKALAKQLQMELEQVKTAMQAKLDQAEAMIAELQRDKEELRARCEVLATEAAEARGKMQVLESLVAKRERN